MNKDSVHRWSHVKREQQKKQMQVRQQIDIEDDSSNDGETAVSYDGKIRENDRFNR